MSTIQNVSVNQVQSWLQLGKVVLIDVREPGEFKTESIAGAKNLPLSQVTMDVAHMPEHQGKKLVFVCRSGKRAQMACEKIMREGASFDLWNLEGGMLAWARSGAEVVRGSKKLLPLDQQVQLTISMMILSGLLLGNFVSPAWYVLPFIAGLGLLNAGLTGWCGMAKLIAKMPWNR